MFVFDPKVHSQRDVIEGCQYSGETYKTSYATFNNDGSAMFTNFDNANQYMVNAQKLLGVEQSLLYLVDGNYFMFPNYQNKKYYINVND